MGHLVSLGGLDLPNLEFHEQMYPVRYIRHEQRIDNAGAGATRGGTGVRYEADILVPETYLGNVIKLCTEKHGVQRRLHFSGRQVALTYELPMSEVVTDFFDTLKSTSRGFASLDYRFVRYAPAKLAKVDILINGERVDALSAIVHQDGSRAGAEQRVL